MKYLCICSYTEAAFKAMTPEMGKELMGPFFIVEAERLDEAVEIAKLHPGAHIDPKWLGEGAIEVWPLESLEEVRR